ncbi:MAG TPA: sulfite exporter TauE/SafE family protein [Actinomycetota bacterium]
MAARRPWTRRARGPSTTGAVVVGVASGFLAGLFGVGGGILIVPGLVFLGMRQRPAHGTSLAAIIPIAAAGIVGFWIEGSVDWPVAAVITVGAATGAFLGTIALQRLEGRALRLGFAVLLLATAARLFLEVPDRAGRADLDLPFIVGLLLVGLFAGVVAGLFGVGGGVVIVPALVILFSIPDTVAKGTSLVVILPAALVGTARNLRYGNLDVAASVAVGLSGVVTAFLSSKLAIRMDPRLSVILFAGLLVAVTIRLLVVERQRTIARREGRWPPPEEEAGLPEA